MSGPRRVLIVLLALAVSWAAGPLDLCACGPDGHGGACAEGLDVAPASPPPGSSCCAARAPARESDAGSIGARACDCPLLAAQPQTAEEAPAPASAAASTSSFALAADLPDAAWRPAQRAACGRAAQPPPKLRRHLLLHVLRC